MITFKGSQKQFFKEYTKDKRSLDEIYCIVSYNVITKKEMKNYYKFIGSTSEKNFKKVDEPKDAEQSTNDTNVSNVTDEPSIRYCKHLKEMKELAKTLNAGGEEDVQLLQKKVLKAKDWCCLVDEDTIAMLNDLAIRMFYIGLDESEWDIDVTSPDDIQTFICRVSDYVKTAAMFSGKYELYVMCEFYDSELIETMARLQDEWRSRCCALMKDCRTLSAFDFDVTDRLNKLIKHMSRIAHGYLNDITKIRNDYKWFGQTFDKITNRRGRVVSIHAKFSALNSYLQTLYVENQKYLVGDNDECEAVVEEEGEDDD